jgi:hypothetical protein
MRASGEIELIATSIGGIWVPDRRVLMPFSCAVQPVFNGFAQRSEPASWKAPPSQDAISRRESVTRARACCGRWPYAGGVV